jgi:hypothetical protein
MGLTARPQWPNRTASPLPKRAFPLRPALLAAASKQWHTVHSAWLCEAQAPDTLLTARSK